MTQTAAPMTDEEFDAQWEARVEAAAVAGDAAEVERLMIAHGDAIAERYSAGE